MFIYKINSDYISIFGNNVLNSTTQARLDATQASCTLKIFDLTDGAAESDQTVTLTYAADGNYSFPLTAINGVMTAGHIYQGTLSKAGMIDIEVVFGVVTAGAENLTTGQKTDVKTQIDTAIGTDTISEQGVGTPTVTPTLKEALSYIYAALINDGISTADQISIHNSAGTIICKAAITKTGVQIQRSRYTTP